MDTKEKSQTKSGRMRLWSNCSNNDSLEPVIQIEHQDKGSTAQLSKF
jgi:hypothetical protein